MTFFRFYLSFYGIMESIFILLCQHNQFQKSLEMPVFSVSFIVCNRYTPRFYRQFSHSRYHLARNTSHPKLPCGAPQNIFERLGVIKNNCLIKFWGGNKTEIKTVKSNCCDGIIRQFNFLQQQSNDGQVNKNKRKKINKRKRVIITALSI